jgi:PadR family transcriptional regulator PadR
VTRVRHPSSQTIRVLRALMADPLEWRYGYELGSEIGLRSGSLYPILVRLSDRGLLESAWEQAAAHGRPPRHLYRLTALGREYAAVHQAKPAAVPPRRPGLQPGGAR